ncbi:uncharacterized protein LOC135010635 isoform X6 [Pseudophryne corroboree]|uniref:uncharacterized protein LOC135010635 isoform X6 n=1 Tax=Pseudophryne corroboree TaxID=495146 RepID=UPI0030820ECA
MTVQIVLPLLLVLMQISLAELSCSSCRAFSQPVQAQVEKEIALEVAKQNILSKLHLQQRPNISHTVPRESLALALLRLNITLDEDHSVQLPTQNGEEDENLGIDQNHEIISFAEIDKDGNLNKRPSSTSQDKDRDNNEILPTSTQDLDGNLNERPSTASQDKDGDNNKILPTSTQDQDGILNKKLSSTSQDKDGDNSKIFPTSTQDQDGILNKKPSSTSQDQDGIHNERPSSTSQDKDRDNSKIFPTSTQAQDGIHNERPSSTSQDKDGDNSKIFPTSTQDQDGIHNERPSSTSQDKEGDNSKIFPTSTQDPEQLHSYQRVLGEIALQLERRILFSIFPDQPLLHGFVVSNIEEKIYQVTTCPLTKSVDEAKRSVLYHRYHDTLKKLKKLGYDKTVHPFLAEYLVNTYGLLNVQPPIGTNDRAPYSQHPEELRNMVAAVTPTEILKEVYILLECLIYLAEDAGKPLFSW